MPASPSPPLWNSLEIAKLLLGLLTPAAVAALGFYLQRVAGRLENRKWANQKIVERRLAIYDEIAPMLNDLLCYFTYVGRVERDGPAQRHQVEAQSRQEAASRSSSLSCQMVRTRSRLYPRLLQNLWGSVGRECATTVPMAEPPTRSRH